MSTQESSSLIDLLDNNIQSSSDFSRFLEAKARSMGFPLNGSFELTPLCNLDCKMCYVHLSDEQIKDESLLTKDQWLSLMKQAIDAGMMYASLTGGECLTYPEFDDIYLFLLSNAVRVSILTNGLLLSPERLQFFKTHRPSSIQITLYGCDNDSYENTTGHRVFEQVFRNLLSALSSGLSVKVGITPNRYMGNADEQLMELLIKNRIPFSLNSQLYAARPETGRMISEFDQPIEDYIRLRNLYIKQREIDIPTECTNHVTPILPPIGIKCGAGNSGFNIDWRGKMYACAMLPDIFSFPLEEGFIAAWKRIHTEAQKYPNPTECRTCKYSPLCTKCVAAHRSGAEPGHANPRICEQAKHIAELYSHHKET